MSKGASYQNDLGYLTSFLTDNYYFPNLAPQSYNLVLDSNVVDDNSFKYRFFDTTDNRVKFAKIYSLFSHLKSGLLFKGVNDVVKNNSISIQLIDDYKKIRSIYLQDINTKWGVGMLLYRDVIMKLVKEKQSDSTNKWYGTNPNLPWVAEIYSSKRSSVDVNDLYKYLFIDLNLGNNYHVIGTLGQRFIKGSTQPFIHRRNNVEIKQNEQFYIHGTPKREPNTFNDSILEDCTWIGNTTLSDHDRGEINKHDPNFCFRHLSRYESHTQKTRSTQWRSDDVNLFSSSEYKKSNTTFVNDIKEKFMKFSISNDKYKD